MQDVRDLYSEYFELLKVRYSKVSDLYRGCRDSNNKREIWQTILLWVMFSMYLTTPGKCLLIFISNKTGKVWNKIEMQK